MSGVCESAAPNPLTVPKQTDDRGPFGGEKLFKGARSNAPSFPGLHQSKSQPAAVTTLMEAGKFVATASGFKVMR